jgi:flavin reductase (DIM6/NTAB) family NADH-FMN oxidoreductase RutF
MVPQSILACINQTASIWRPLRSAGRYCVNLLRDTNVDISKRFTGSLPIEDRFLVGDWHRSEDGIPFLADAQANIFCELDQAFPYATHDVLIGRVTSSMFNADVSPLLYQNGSFAIGAPLALATAA